MPGKLPPSVLMRIISNYRGCLHENVLLPACIGEDAGVSYVSNGYVLVVHTDPITASKNLIGKLSIHVSANDVASTGARPLYFTLTLLLPDDYGFTDVEHIMSGVNSALKELGASLIGGHTEFTSAIKRPVAVSTAIGIASLGEIVRTSTCRVGDYVIMTKTAGLEGTSVLAEDYEEELVKAGVDESVIREARKLIDNVSVVKEAIALSTTRVASAMHDATEGGVLNALYEIALSSRKRLIVYKDKVPVHYTTSIITKRLGIDPLSILSSGVLAACIPAPLIDRAIGILRYNCIQTSIIGRVECGDPEVIIKNKHGECRVVKECIEDPVIKMSEKLS